MRGRRELHVHESRCAGDTRRLASVQHDEAVRQRVVVHVGVGEVLLILVHDLAHLRAHLLSVGMAPANGAAEQVASLCRRSLLANASSVHGQVGVW